MSEPQDPALQQARQRWHQVARFKLRHLVLLDAIGELRNLRLAAEHTHMTQPAASHMLKHIEGLLGLPLFERGKHGLRPNPEGELMIRYARRMIHDLLAAQSEIQQLDQGLAGSILVGSVQSSASQILPRTTAQALQEQGLLRILPFELGQLLGALTIVTLKNGVPRRSVQALVQALRATAAQEQTAQAR